MIEPSTVVLWGGQSETEEVLKAVFEPRGHTVRLWRSNSFPASEISDGIGVMSGRAPQLLVVDEHDNSVPPCEQWAQIPRIIIGKISSAKNPVVENGRYKMLSHPFEYRELVSAIESML